MSKAGANNDQTEIQKLLNEIDGAVSVDDIGKEMRLTDAKGNLKALQADLVGLRRMLIQHPKPDAPVQELNGQTLGAAIREKIRQSKRLEDYISELEELPDDPPDEEEPEASSEASSEAGLQGIDDPDRLEDTEEPNDD